MNALVPTNIQLPAHMSGRVSNITGAMTDGISTGGGGFKRISKRGSRFRIRDGKDEHVLPDPKLRAIIVGASPNITKSFYKGSYNPKAEEQKGPDCYSNDGVRPEQDSPDAQAQQCATCPQNAWGSKVSDNGNKMKACSDQKKLALISADDDSDDPEVYQYIVTPTELKAFQAYGNQLASKGFPAELVITELSFDTDQSFPKIEFKFGGFVDEVRVATIDKLVGSDKVLEITGEKAMTAKVVEDEAPKPLPVKVKEEYVPKVEVEDAVFEEAAPVVKKSGFGSTAVKPAPTSPTPPKAPPVVQSSSLAADIQSILDGMEESDD